MAKCIGVFMVTVLTLLWEIDCNIYLHQSLQIRDNMCYHLFLYGLQGSPSTVGSATLAFAISLHALHYNRVVEVKKNAEVFIQSDKSKRLIKVTFDRIITSISALL